MNQTDLSTTTPSERGAAPVEPSPGPDSSSGTAGRVVPFVIGALLVLVSLVLLGSGGTGMWGYLTQRDAGYVTTGVHKFSTAGSALATEPTDLGSGGIGWLYSPTLLDKIRIRVTPASPGPPLFVGIARSEDVERYLAGVDHTIVSDFWGNEVKAVGGARPSSPPGSHRFWVASSSGAGTRSLVWKPADGKWTVVVMNADGRPRVDIGADLGARMPALPWIALGLLVGGVVFMAGGALLIVGALRRRGG